MRGGYGILVALTVAAGLAGAIAEANVAGGANVRTSFEGWLTPKALPRQGEAPVALHLRGRLWTTDGREPPPLESVTIAINSHGRVSTAGLPVCRRRSIEAETSAQALARCRGALVGSGRFNAHIVLPDQAPFPARGRLLAFNSLRRGRPVILAHIYGKQPVPIVQVLTMGFQRAGSGSFGTTLSLRMPAVQSEWGHVTGFALDLERRYTFEGRRRSVISAGCPAPSGFSSAVFAAAKGTYHLADGRDITRVVTGRCRVRSAE
jgi:hypothetical protein